MIWMQGSECWRTNEGNVTAFVNMIRCTVPTVYAWIVRNDGALVSAGTSADNAKAFADATAVFVDAVHADVDGEMGDGSDEQLT